jgi:signal transduction histidine kinase
VTARRRPLEVALRVAVVGLALVVDLTIWNEERQLRGGGHLPFVVIPVLTVVVYSTLLLRGRYPRSVLALQWAFALASSLLVPQFQPVAGLLLALHAVASCRPPRESALWLASLAVPFGVQSYNTSVVSTGDQERNFAFLFLLWLLIGLAVWAVGRLSYSAARRAWRLRELETAESAKAVRAERLRLARELHDIVSHAVTGMMLQAAGAQALLRPTDERLRTSLAVIEATGVEAMGELHRMLGLLHAADPDLVPGSVAPGPTVADIPTLLKLAAEAGRNLRLVQEGKASALDPSVETAAYRIVQEGLTNSGKHAGSSAEVTVTLNWSENELEVAVIDRSRGPRSLTDRGAMPSSGRGLRGLTERVSLVGGTLTSGPTADGFALIARLPRPVPALAALDTVG